jgi:hypothetical protein
MQAAGAASAVSQETLVSWLATAFACPAEHLRDSATARHRPPSTADRPPAAAVGATPY